MTRPARPQKLHVPTAQRWEDAENQSLTSSTPRTTGHTCVLRRHACHVLCNAAARPKGEHRTQNSRRRGNVRCLASAFWAAPKSLTGRGAGGPGPPPTGRRPDGPVWTPACSFGWCWFVPREKYCWLVDDGWFVLREKYCWLVADKPRECRHRRHTSPRPRRPAAGRTSIRHSFAG
jgi:hypothetical protein